jgi:outer membrane protein assembly factor BamD (BamD/ComL family)
MHGRWKLLILPLLTSWLAAGCASGGMFAPLASHRERPAALAEPPVPRLAADEPVLRSQSPDDAGLFTAPSWDSIKQSTAYNNVMKLFGRDRDEAKARQLYQEGDELFLAKKYDEAASKYKGAARHYADTDLEEDALFMLGECLFFSDEYPNASDAYGELLKKYDNTRHLDKVVARQFAIADYWKDLNRAKPRATLNPNIVDRTRPTWDTTGNAIKAFESVRLYDPTGPLADDSVFATANEHFVNEKFDDADYFYTLLRDDYPKSEYLMKAYILGLRAKLRKYNGPQYDSAPLVEAEALIDQMLSQMPDELDRDEYQKVVQAGRIVRAQMAERDWQMGEFYYRTRYYRAASTYYKNILKDFAETEFAKLATERLEEIKDLPPEPPQRLKWLTNLFPGESKRKYAR